ncbi:MAG: sortase [Chloroflexi bacterium]|nr:sortase [Chloroflexota bacterium]
MSQRLTMVGGALLLVLGAWLITGGGATVPVAVSTPTPSASASFATSRPPTTDVPTATPGQRAIPDGYRVQIPRLAIDLAIQEGDLRRDIDLQQTPENLAFHLPGTALPGQADNTYLYAHARRGMFLSLWDAKAGDTVYISTPDGKLLTYEVREVLPRVGPTDVSVAQHTTSERLTLQTSTGPNPSDPRFVVLAYPKRG